MRCRTASRFLTVSLASLGLGLAACHEVPTETVPVPGGPARVISDGAHAGNPHVFFLPPMLPDPSASFSAAFDGSLDVAIHICVWNSADQRCGPSLEMYNRNTGPGAEAVRVPEGAEYYLVNWHTDEILDQFPLGANETYRIRVLVDRQVVAFADVQVVGTARELKSVSADQFIPLLDGRTLPIKVRVEEGWEAYGIVETLDAGGIHTCRLTEAGKAYCWGSNRYGQVGNGGYAWSEPTPVPVYGPYTFGMLSTGGDHTCGITTDGQTYCWGQNQYGQLGVGSNYVASNVPVEVRAPEPFSLVSAGQYHTCGITASGEAYCWGVNADGQLGDGGRTVRNLPVPVATSLRFAGISAGYIHTCGITTGGEAWCWGYNRLGAVGKGAYSGLEPLPVPVATTASFSALGLGTFHTCGLTTEGVVLCWGYNGFGQLGVGDWRYSERAPVPVASAARFAALNSGYGGWAHTCAVTAAGEGACWGDNGNGQLGDGSQLTRYAPVRVASTEAFAAISTGLAHSCGLTTTGRALCWGENRVGQLGDPGVYPYAYSPNEVVEPRDGW